MKECKEKRVIKKNKGIWEGVKECKVKGEITTGGEMERGKGMKRKREELKWR